MPEGHTIHRAARDHRKLFAGEVITVSSPQGRFRHGASVLNEQTLADVTARGKHLFYHWEHGDVLHVHLGLYGKFRTPKLKDGEVPPEPRGQVRMRWVTATAVLDLNGPTRCELFDSAAFQAKLAALGPDPLDRKAEPERAWQRISKSRAAIGTLLLNQEVIAGVGNVYRAEVLHLLGIHPDRAGRDLHRAEFDLLWEKLVELLAIGVKYNRIIVASPEDIGKSRGRMTRNERLRVYKRPRCAVCDAPIERWTLGNRTIFACNACQH